MIKTRIVSMLLAATTLITSFSLCAFAEGTTLKEELLQTPAYFKTTVTECDTFVSEKPSVEEQNKFATLSEEWSEMSNKQLNQLVRESLKTVIEDKEKGDGNITWNKNFIDKIAKANFPDLYQIMYKQEKKDSSTQDGDMVSAADYAPGRKVLTFSKYAYHWTGYTLWGFFCRMDWSWDGTKITSVYPNTYGEVYDPSWGYAGIIANNQRFTNGEIEFNKYVKGDFYWPMQQMVSTHRYPWLNIYVYPNGGYYWTSGM